MVDWVLIAALALGVLGVVGSVAPLLPGPALSLSGIYVYWWSTGYADPWWWILALLTVVGVVGVLVDYFGGAIGAKAGGADRRTTVAAAVVGGLLFFVAGPLGVLVGVGATVFGLEYRRHGDGERSLRAAGYAAVAILGSIVVQLLLALSLFAALVVIVVV